MRKPLELMRNLKYALRMTFHPSDHMTVEALCALVDGKADFDKVNPSSKIAFLGFNNEFDTVFGKNSIFICLNRSEDEFAHYAIMHGAIAVLSDHQIDDLPCILVEDIEEAFDTLCACFYDRHPIPATVIAGSIGKTSTTQMTEAVYRSCFRTYCAPINGNVLQYLGFMLQHTPKRAQRLVQEIDESYPNNASRCSKVLRPQIALITNIDKSHIGALGGEKAVIRAITSVADFIPDDGYVIINSDDKNSTLASFRQRVYSVAIDDTLADCRAENIRLLPEQTIFDLRFQDETVRVTLNCPGKHNIYNAMMAFVAGKLSGIPTKAILRGLRHYKPGTVRQSTYKSFGKTLYVDCFNASARSVDAALKVIDNFKPGKKGKRIAVLGDILEIDGYEAETYASIAESIDRSKVDELLTYGSTISDLWPRLVRSNIGGKHFSDKEELYQHIRKKVKRGDVVLFKASGIMGFEHLVEKLYPLTIFLGEIPYYIQRVKWLFITL